MRVLADLHHGALYESLRLLFEKRLGGTVLRPLGMEWFDRGHWAYPHYARETAAQFLDPAGSYKHPGISAVDFLDCNIWRDFDLMLSSTPDQFYAWERMRAEHGITIPHLFQMGNRWPVPHGCRFLLNSTTVPATADCHAVYYHQEFPLADFEPPHDKPGKVIASLMHYMAEQDKRGWFDSLRAEMPDWTFLEHGAGGRDGAAPDVAAVTRAARYIYHPKKVEAYGYVVHQAAACGVPLIMRAAANTHEAIGALLNPATCLDLDEYASPGHLADAIRRFDKEWWTHSLAIARAFREHVDFDAEAARIAAWLQTVIVR